MGSRWLSLRWAPPLSAHAAVSHYLVQYQQEDGDGGWKNVTINGNAHTARLGGLEPASRYTLRLMAGNEVGTSTPSKTTTAITLQEGKITSFTLLV